ncbi:MAG TPA: hypothetical protein VF131_11635 [Blastocatellia bacterium]|nr:hypothetical protein [Blastocatellia bacterium]
MRVAITGALITTIGALALLAFGADMQANNKESMQAQLSPGGQKPASDSVQLFVQTEEEMYIPGEPILLKVVVRNNTQNTIFIVDTRNPARDFKFDVRNEEGESVALTKDGEDLVNNTAIFRRVAVEIKPGKEVEHSFTINKLFEMTVPGTYSVTVKREIRGQDGHPLGEVTSNTVKIKVVR